MTIGEQRHFEKIEKELEENPGIAVELRNRGHDDAAMYLWMRWKCLIDLYYLGSVILGLDKVRDAKTRRKRLDPALHKEMARNLEKEVDKLLLYPRLHLKTCWVKFRVVQLILRSPLNRIGLWSITQKLAKKELKSIKAYCQLPILRDLFPEVVKPRKKWQIDQAEAFLMYRDPEEAGDIQEGQVEIWGIESRAVGHHYDYHFYDDPIDERTVRSETGIEKVRTWWQHIQAIRDLSAVETMTGTRYHQQDIYGEILAEQYFPLVVTKSYRKGNGKLLYKFFREKDIQRLKTRMGAYNFGCQMENRPVPPGDRIFVSPYPRYPELPDEKLKWYISADPAYTTKSWSNKTGISVGCVTRKGNTVYVKESRGYKEKPQRIAEILVEKIVQYQPVRLAIETNLGETLQFILDVKVNEYEKTHETKVRMPDIMWISTGNRLNKKMDKIRNTVGTFVSTGRMKFAHDGDFKECFTQMDLLNPYSTANDDDIVDSLAMLIQGIENFVQHSWYHEDTQKTRGFTIDSLFKKKKGKKWSDHFAA